MPMRSKAGSSVPEATCFFTARALAKFATVLIAVGACPVWAWTGKVTHVTDGDTLWVRPDDAGKPVKIRLDGVDAPEICQDGGRAARDALAGRLADRSVEVATRRQDDYGRSIAGVHHDGQDVAGWMVSQGHAWSSRWGRKGGRYQALQARAEAENRGLFADPKAVEPRLFRKQHGPCKL